MNSDCLRTSTELLPGSGLPAVITPSAPSQNRRSNTAVAETFDHSAGGVGDDGRKRLTDNQTRARQKRADALELLRSAVAGGDDSNMDRKLTEATLLTEAAKRIRYASSQQTP